MKHHRMADRWPSWHRLGDKTRERVVEAELNRLMTPSEVAEFLEEIADAAGRSLTPSEITQILGHGGAGQPGPTSTWSRLPTVEALITAYGECGDRQSRMKRHPQLKLAVSNDR
jgi:hypothetical protein